MASSPRERPDIEGEAQGDDPGEIEHVSTATSAATADQAKQEEIRRERDKIIAAQENIRRLTGGRKSRAGSDIVSVGSTQARVTRTVTDKMEVTASPSVFMDPITGAVKQLPPPPAPPMQLPGSSTDPPTGRGTTGETTDTATSGSGSKSVTLVPGKDEVIAVECTAMDDKGRRIRLRTTPDNGPAVGEIISIGNMYGPGLPFKGKITDVSEPRIFPKSRVSDIVRSDRSKARRAEREAAEAAAAAATAKETETAAAYAAMTAEFKKGDEVVLDVDVPPPPRADETEEQVIQISDDDPPARDDGGKEKEGDGGEDDGRDKEEGQHGEDQEEEGKDVRQRYAGNQQLIADILNLLHSPQEKNAARAGQEENCGRSRNEDSCVKVVSSTWRFGHAAQSPP